MESVKNEVKLRMWDKLASKITPQISDYVWFYVISSVRDPVWDQVMDGVNKLIQDELNEIR